MRQKRAKQYRRLLQQYQLHFNFRAPFQLLLDDSLTLHLAKEASSPTAPSPLLRLADVLQQPPDAQHVKLMITQCAMVALYNLEKSSDATQAKLGKTAVALAKEFERRRCNHREAIEAESCIADVVGGFNKHRYILGTGRLGLRTGVGKACVGLPVVHPNQTGVLVMAPMSEVTKARVAELEKAALKGPSTTPLPSNVITGPIPPPTSTSTGEPSQSQSQSPANRKRKVKEPNPLSVKKKKPSKPNAPAKQGTGRPRK
ncbi:unnamed protein product [Tilletia controversa]|uniref:UTP23 sensor motif region domain-containing protein n=3 Tax=Tilletia TaxID=13289 RepID=A0A8X7SZ23_9BASI|nr:hypothetical protein CF336_g2064 [Tilletia laevis]KAE8202888.1 hypothetical protein CF328_g1959 [Tilletia controversa]KAE8263535.1 hypothetical protein A4X03_0g1609 [Tilletia caries]KAE8207101.1 hypothetical protein CF335_g1394 [Tilletia laevis]KAE8251900.1 hypothetical protein A4X06_0g2490 [Tilletia controversa]